MSPPNFAQIQGSWTFFNSQDNGIFSMGHGLSICCQMISSLFTFELFMKQVNQVRYGFLQLSLSYSTVGFCLFLSARAENRQCWTGKPFPIQIPLPSEHSCQYQIRYPSLQGNLSLTDTNILKVFLDILFSLEWTKLQWKFFKS